MKMSIQWSAAPLVLLALLWTMAAGAAQPDTKSDAARTDLTETDMSHTGSTPAGKVTVPWNLLGGAVGNRTVNGVRVELYVLEAQELDQVKAGDSNHAFTVTLKDDQTGEFLKQGAVSIAVAGGSGAVHRSVMSARSSGIFRSGVSLPQPGDYRLTIAFEAAGRKGEADFPYEFHPVAGAKPAHHH
jgi:hypothetical protein